VEKRHLRVGLVRLEQMLGEGQSKVDFDVLADEYDLWYESARGAMYDHLEKKAISKYLPRNVQGAKLLEIGCGTGHWSQFFSEYGFEVTGVDISGRMIEIAQNKRIANSSFQVADGQSLPFGDRSFDVAAAITTLEFVDNAESVLTEMTRCTRKPAGQLLIGVLNGLAGFNRRRSQEAESLYAKARLFSPRQLKQLLEQYGQTRMTTAAFVPSQERFLFLSPLVDTVGRFLHLPYGVFVAAAVRL
jgi:ubiquinone/menaquinone biosynthesis C-methylase UbiE